MKLSELLKTKKWNEICKHPRLKESFIEENISNIRFGALCRSQVLSENFLNKYFDNIKHWKTVLKKSKFLTTEFLERGIAENKFTLRDVIYTGKATEELINKNIDSIDFHTLPGNNLLSEEFHRKYSDKLNFNFVGYRYNLSDDFLIEFMSKINWSRTKISKLSIRVIKELSKTILYNWYNNIQKCSDSQLFNQEFLQIMHEKLKSYLYRPLSRRVSSLSVEKFERFLSVLEGVVNYVVINECQYNDAFKILSNKQKKMNVKQKMLSEIKSCQDMRFDFVNKYYFDNNISSKSLNNTNIYFSVNVNIQHLKDNFDIYFRNDKLKNRLSAAYRLTDNFINEFKDNIDYTGLSYNKHLFKLSPDVFDSISGKLDWSIVSCYKFLPKEIMFKYEDKIFWDMVGAKIPRLLFFKHLRCINVRKQAKSFTMKDVESNEYLKEQYLKCPTKKMSFDFIKENLNKLSCINVANSYTLIKEKTKFLYSIEERDAIREIFAMYKDLT